MAIVDVRFKMNLVALIALVEFFILTMTKSKTVNCDIGMCS